MHQLEPGALIVEDRHTSRVSSDDGAQVQEGRQEFGMLAGLHEELELMMSAWEVWKDGILLPCADLVEDREISWSSEIVLEFC